MGGIVVDADGKPVAGVTGPSQHRISRNAPARPSKCGSGARATTDAAGKWHFDSVPVSMAEVHVSVDHPGYRPLRRQLARRDFGIEPGREPIGQDRAGARPDGDRQGHRRDGKPIAGALVRTKFLNDIREAKTGPDGVYKLVGCEPGPSGSWCPPGVGPRT